MAAALIFSGCTEQVSIKHNADNSISLSVKSQSSKNTAALISSFAGDVMIDSDAAEDALLASGAENARVETSGGADFLLSAQFSGNKRDSLSPLFSESADKNHFILTLSPSTIAQFIALLPSETSEYAELLIAPVFTGDKMSASEYADTLSAVYGSAIGDEMKAAKVEFSVTSKNGIKQTLNVSLAEILALQETKKYTFDW